MNKTFLVNFFLLLAFISYAQNTIHVAGIILGEDDNEPVIGANVTVKGGTQGTITDVLGKFEINLSPGDVLKVSFMGYKTFEQKINDSNTSMRIVLKNDSYMLDEVIAIGYGTMRKSDLTGAVGSVSGKELRVAPVPKIDQALQGRMAGVTVNSNSGQPGADAIIRIRGVGTINNASPIYVVDGVITDNINFLSPSDIASLEVLKDASAAAIYGSRGANGVILISTKQGDTAGKSNITFESYYGVQNRWKKMDVMGRDEFANVRAILGNTKDELDQLGLNGWIQSNYTPKRDTRYPRVLSDDDPDGIDYTLIDTDWQDEIFVKDASIENYYLSVDGGTDKSNYMFSANYFNQNGILIGSYYNRLTLRLNTSFQVKKWLKIGENLSFSNSHSRGVQGNSNTALIASALSMAPWDPVTYPDGSFSNYTNKIPKRDMSGEYASPSLFRNVIHPYHQVFNSKPFNNNDDWVGNLYAEITPLKGLIIRGDVGMKLWNGMSRSFTPVLDVIYNAITRNGVSANMQRSQQLIYTGTATYNTNIADKHDFTIMLGATAEDFNSYSVSASGSNLETTDPKDWYVSRTPDLILQNDDGSYYSTRSGSDGVGKGRMASYLGRLHYSYDNKYLLTTNVRIDGSSKLTKGHYWDIFPSVAAAWKVSEEDFFDPLINTFDFFKVRLGWGRLGNERTLSETGAIPSISDGVWMMGYAFGYPNAVVEGRSLTTYPTLLVWEYTEQFDLGIDFSLFNSFLHGNIDFFNRSTHDMHMVIRPPAHVGFRYSPTGNAATVVNRGIELTLEHSKKIGPLTYNLGGNISFIKNELKALNGAEPLWDGIIMNDQGYGLNTIYTLVYDGVFKSQEEIDSYTTTVMDENGNTVDKIIQPFAKVGDARYKDLNQDGEITDLDRKDVGNPFPKITYGFNGNVELYGFDLQLFFQGVSGNKVYNYLRQNKLEFDGTESVLSRDMKNVFFPGPDPNDPSKIINVLPDSDGSIPNQLQQVDRIIRKLPADSWRMRLTSD